MARLDEEQGGGGGGGSGSGARGADMPLKVFNDVSGDAGDMQEQDEGLEPSVEQVALTVSTTDDPTLPVCTFRMWCLGILSCALLSFLNQFFSYRTAPLIITSISAQIVALPAGRLMAALLPTRHFRLPFTGSMVSLNPGPFNMKEHVLITIFANAGSAFGNGGAYAVSIVDIIKAFYHRKIQFHVALLVVIATQVLGYGWAGLFRRYLVEPTAMWWPSNLVQVSLFRTLHEAEETKGLSRLKFFLLFMVLSFSYYVVPGYLFMMLTSVSWVCWVFPRSVLAQQLGSGMHGLGIGSFSLDWVTAVSFLGSPLVSPFFAIVNILVGFVLILYVMVPICYWGNVYNARRYPIFSSHLFNSRGHQYDIQSVLTPNLELNTTAYAEQGNIELSTFFAMTYGIGFAAIAATITHVLCFHGKEIFQQSRSIRNVKPDIHSQLMKRYSQLPNWWFLVLLVVTLLASMGLTVGFERQLQLPWWGICLAAAIAATFTLPIGIITATTNQTPGLNIITELIAGYLWKGKPVANVCFKTYGYMSMTQALAFLADFKLGHYMKIPPRTMFTVQVVGTILAACVNMGVAWWLLNGIENICDTNKLPASSPWTCPNAAVFFDASVIWGLVGPQRIFFSRLSEYRLLSWFFLGGALSPVPFWLLYKAFPSQTWLTLVNMPLMLGATGMMPPATPVNYTTWLALGIIFNFFIFRYRKAWWRKYNYVLSAALDAGSAFMAVALYLALGLENRSLTWWGNDVDRCPLAKCPTAPGILVDGCPHF